MIEKIILQFGPTGKNANLEFNPDSVTVFVGPNNSGKSLILKEIEIFCNNGQTSNLKILHNINFQSLNDEKLKQNIKSMEIPPKQHEFIPESHIKYGRLNATKGFRHFVFDPQDLCSWKNSSQQRYNFISYYVSMYVSRFGGKERFNLVKTVPFFDLQSHPPNSLSYLFQDNDKRIKVRSLIYKAFGKYFVINPTSMKNLEIRLSNVEPTSENIEKGWTDQSKQFHKAAKPITEFSDGIQAFTGLIMTVIAGEEKTILLDEPEAFLHPSLVSFLGETLSMLMSKREGNLIVATHSPFFIMGCLQSGIKMNIVRLTYDEATYPTAKLLDSNKVAKLFKNPLLRSTGVIEALFHSAVVVTEGDTDRAFYSEINQRLLTQDKPEGITNALFLNAQNKQTVWDIVSPLRNMGIPTIGIVDIDFIKDGPKEFTKALKAAGVSSTLHESLQTARHAIKKAFKKTGKDMKRNGGISLLKKGERELVEKFLTDLQEYGIFIVPGGEIESWLKTLECTSHGPNWLIQIFNKIGDDPKQSNYLKPSQGDVWDFLRSINKWIKNPNRKGMKIYNEN